MKRWLAIILCLVVLPIEGALAQQPDDRASKEDVHKLFDVMQSRKRFDVFMNVIRQAVPGMTNEVKADQLPNATPEESAKLNEYMNLQSQKLFEAMPYDELIEAMVPAYQHHLTHEEIQEIIHLYSSPAGQKMLEEMPAILAEGMQAGLPVIQKWMQGRLDEVKISAELYAKTLREKKTRTNAPSVKPAS
jgi:uncharacterized protein